MHRSGRTASTVVATCAALALLVVLAAPAGAGGKGFTLEWGATPLTGTAGELVTIQALPAVGSTPCTGPVRLQLWDATNTQMLTDNGTGDGFPDGIWEVALDVSPTTVPDPGTYSLRLLCQDRVSFYFDDKVFTLTAPAETTTTTAAPSTTASVAPTTAATSPVTAQPRFTG